jgi:hypothetical protein
VLFRENDRDTYYLSRDDRQVDKIGQTTGTKSLYQIGKELRLVKSCLPNNAPANTCWHWSGRSSAWWGSWLLGLLTALWEECGAVVAESGCHLLLALDPKIP